MPHTTPLNTRLLVLVAVLFSYAIYGGLIGLAFCNPCQSCTNGDYRVLAVSPVSSGDTIAYHGTIMFIEGEGERILDITPVLGRCDIGDEVCIGQVRQVNSTGECFIKKVGRKRDRTRLYLDSQYDDRSYIEQCPEFTWSLVTSAIVGFLIPWFMCCFDGLGKNRKDQQNSVVDMA